MGAAEFFAPNLLENRVAFVTGGGTGIGKSIAIALGRCGAAVAVASRDRKNVENGCAEIQKATGREVFGTVCDIRESDQVEKTVAQIGERFGPIDLLVNNAGGQFPQRAEKFSIKGWNAVIDNNLNGTWYVTQCVGRGMIANGGGAIVNILANYHRGIPGVAHTSAARAAVANLAKTLAIEWAPHGIRINSVASGPIDTNGFARTYYEGIGAHVENLPLARFGTVDEVAAAVLFLASDASSWTTGSVLDVSGGQQIWGDMWTVDPSEK